VNASGNPRVFGKTFDTPLSGVTLVYRSRKEKVIKVLPHEEDLIVSIYA